MVDSYDEEDEERQQRPSVEGVRIIGPEEAETALEAGAVTRRLRDDQSRVGDAPSRPQPPAPPAVRFPFPTDFPHGTGATDTDADNSGQWRFDEMEPSVDVGEPTGEQGLFLEVGSAELPHWSEPPTGEVPRALPGSPVQPIDQTTSTTTDAFGEPVVEDDLAAWSALSTQAPRYRDQPSDWAEADFIEGEFTKDDSMALGALADEVDEDQEFQAEVGRRRSRRFRSRGLRAVPESESAKQPERQREQRPEPQGATSLGPLEVGRAVPPARYDPGPDRDMGTAVATGVVLIAVALLAFSVGRGATAWLAAVIVALATAEVYAEARKLGYQPASLLGLIGAMSLVLGSYAKGEAAFPIVIGLMAVFTPLWYLAQVVRARPVVNMALTILGFGYVGVLGGFAGLLLAHPKGLGLLAGTAICVVAHDVGALLIGQRIGSTKLAPTVSPNKTVEGLLGGVSASVFAAVVIVVAILKIEPWDGGSALLLGLLIGIVAPIGDLCESMIKRDLGVKDLGGLLPGHGGVLDRFDGLLFSLPVVYYLVRVLELS